LINNARGTLADENALYEMLKNGHLAGAALDVFENEPYKGNLAELDNVVLTAHIGSYALEVRKIMEMEAASNLLDELINLQIVKRGISPT
ncbi:MAG: NAD(P)-dependent oxidoreductase, partial [Gammaproteobacteria bacterium]